MKYVIENIPKKCRGFREFQLKEIAEILLNEINNNGLNLAIAKYCKNDFYKQEEIIYKSGNFKMIIAPTAYAIKYVLKRLRIKVRSVE